MGPRTLAVLGTTLVAGLAGTAVAVDGHTGNAAFLFDQRGHRTVQPAEVGRVVATAPDPRTGKGKGTAASCDASGRDALGNPWRCVVRYADGYRTRLAVTVGGDGTYTGRYAAGGVASGCCIDSAIR